MVLIGYVISLQPGSAKGGGGGAAGNKKAAAQKAAENKKEEEPEVTITADEMIAEFYDAEENQEELHTDRREVWREYSECIVSRCISSHSDVLVRL